MRTVRTRLPCELTSNLVFSSGGEKIFGLSQEGDLVCVDVPANPDAVPTAPSVRRRAENGAFIAAGWLEGRLGTITLSGNELLLSHGWSGEVGVGTSKPSTVHLDRSEMRISATARLEPYVRWFREVNPIECWHLADTLLRDDDERLFNLSAEPGKVTECAAYLVAEDVRAVAGSEEHRDAVFVGRERRTQTTPEPPRWFGLKRKPRDEPTLRRHWLFRTTTSSGILSVDVPGNELDPSVALVQFHGSDKLVTAVARHPDTQRWTLAWYRDALDPHVHREDFDLQPGETCVGVALTPSREPALVLLDASKRRLFASSQDRSTLYESDAAIDEVAVAPEGPQLLAIRAVRDELVFCWPRA